MATVSFEIKTYEVKIARELNGSAGGVNLKFPAYILCHGDQYEVVVYVLDDTSPVADNTFLPANNEARFLFHVGNLNGSVTFS